MNQKENFHRKEMSDVWKRQVYLLVLWGHDTTCACVETPHVTQTQVQFLMSVKTFLKVQKLKKHCELKKEMKTNGKPPNAFSCVVTLLKPNNVVGSLLKGRAVGLPLCVEVEATLPARLSTPSTV